MGGNKDECAAGQGPVASIAGAIFSKKEWDGLQLFMGENNNGVSKGEGACACLPRGGMDR